MPISQGLEPYIEKNLRNYNSDAYVFIWNVVFSMQNHFWVIFGDIYDKYVIFL